MNPNIPGSGAQPKQVIPLERLRQGQRGKNVPCTKVNAHEVGTLGTGFSYSYAHAEKKEFVEDETSIFWVIEKESEKRVPTVPSPPDLAPMVCALPYDHPRFREPENGEVVVGLYREDDGNAAPVLLWADTRADLFWDLSLRSYEAAGLVFAPRLPAAD